MEKQIAAVEEFHQAYRVPAENSPKASLSIDIIELRHRLMAEENQEYLEAAKDGDLVEVADALGDMMYILAGTMISHGMQ
ncbi:MAG: nucleoside triphosphate pyrophosphohydrolase family protein, partial [Schleiferiaceae bacterium]|nr:nucleoside triphosphate pyrophosphohydrolase family protein [Schleiferiaceae bacterium]